MKFFFSKLIDESLEFYLLFFRNMNCCENKCKETKNDMENILKNLMITDLAHQCVEYFTPCFRCTWTKQYNISGDKLKWIEFYLGRILFGSKMKFKFEIDGDFVDEEPNTSIRSQTREKLKTQELIPFFFGDLNFIRFLLSEEKIQPYTSFNLFHYKNDDEKIYIISDLIDQY